MKVLLSLLSIVCVVQSSFGATVPLRPIDNHVYQPIVAMTNETPIITNRLDVMAMLQQLINQAVLTAVSMAHTLQAYIVNVFEMFQDRLLDVQHNANKILNDMQTNIEQALQRYGDVGTCVKDHIEEVQNVTSTARTEIEVCVSNAQVAVAALREDLQQYIDAISENVAKIQTIISQCSSNETSDTFDIASCVIQHLKDIGESITGIFNDGREGLKIAGLMVYQITGDSQQCVAAVVEKARTETGKILEVIQHCIAEDNAELEIGAIQK